MIRSPHTVLFFLFGICTLFFSCQQDEPLIPEERTFPLVDQRLWSYFEAFEIEAANRGIEVNLVQERITGVIEAIDEEHVAGQCSYSAVTPGEVTVDDEFWTRSNSTFREFIIFHELGHCYLMRDHREDKDQFGFCKSLMRSGVEDCQDRYNLQTRKVYIDELFFPEDF
jgi:hypothetical protein